MKPKQPKSRIIIFSVIIALGLIAIDLVVSFAISEEKKKQLFESPEKALAAFSHEKLFCTLKSDDIVFIFSDYGSQCCITKRTVAGWTYPETTYEVESVICKGGLAFLKYSFEEKLVYHTTFFEKFEPFPTEATDNINGPLVYFDVDLGKDGLSRQYYSIIDASTQDYEITFDGIEYSLN